jgi:hypothetical protein
LFEFGNLRPKIGQTLNRSGTEVSSEEPEERSPVDRRETHAPEFQLKTSTTTNAFLALVLTASLTGVAAAQTKATQTQATQTRPTPFRAQPPASGSRVATETPHPQQTTVIVQSMPGFNQPLNQSVFPRQPVAFTLIPAILMSDGTVLADFGFGFEPVTRACGNTVVMSTPQVIAGNGVVLSPGSTTVTYTQPVPNQATPSQQNLPSAQTRFPVLTAASQSACFTKDAQGRFFVAR